MRFSGISEQTCTVWAKRIFHRKSLARSRLKLLHPVKDHLCLTYNYLPSCIYIIQSKSTTVKVCTCVDIYIYVSENPEGKEILFRKAEYTHLLQIDIVSNSHLSSVHSSQTKQLLKYMYKKYKCKCPRIDLYIHIHI